MLVWCICFVFILISEQIQVAYLKNTNERDILWLNTPVHVNIETLCCSDFVCCAFTMSLFPDLKDECIIIVSVWCRSEMGFDWLWIWHANDTSAVKFILSKCLWRHWPNISDISDIFYFEKREKSAMYSVNGNWGGFGLDPDVLLLKSFIIRLKLSVCLLF